VEIQEVAYSTAYKLSIIYAKTSKFSYHRGQDHGDAGDAPAAGSDGDTHSGAHLGGHTQSRHLRSNGRWHIRNTRGVDVLLNQSHLWISDVYRD
jgi:hypothetical protein